MTFLTTKDNVCVGCNLPTKCIVPLVSLSDTWVSPIASKPPSIDLFWKSSFFYWSQKDQNTQFHKFWWSFQFLHPVCILQVFAMLQTKYANQWKLLILQNTTPKGKKEKHVTIRSSAGFKLLPQPTFMDFIKSTHCSRAASSVKAAHLAFPKCSLLTGT